MNRKRSTKKVDNRYYTLVRDPRLADAKEETKLFPNLSLPLLNSYVDHYHDLKSDIKLQIGQTIFK
jgi:hypothetical protein